MNTDIVRLQESVCEKYKAATFAAPINHKVGISLNVKEGKRPINGMRINPSNDTTGWYIWSGEHLSEEDDFFVPLHVAHLSEWCEEVLAFLLLPPGWRFLLAEDYVDVWFDINILNNHSSSQ